jgi:protein SCO1/2
MRPHHLLPIVTLILAAALLPTAVVSGQATATPSSAPAHYIPNAALLTHEKRPVRFYDDLVKGRTVVVNFMFTSCASICPQATRTLRNVQEVITASAASNVLMLSITVDPETDTPDVLARYAARHEVKPGWLFLTGNRQEVDKVRRRFGASDNDDPDPSQHTGMVIYGNEPLGQWRMINVTRPSDRIADAVLRLAAGRLW